MPRNHPTPQQSLQRAKGAAVEELPAPIRNRLAQSGRVSSPEVKLPAGAAPARR